MNLSEVEVVAGQLVEQTKRLENLNAELSRAQLELKEQPKRSEKDKGFYSLIGLDYQEPSHVKQSHDRLANEKKNAEAAVKQAHETIVKGFASSELVVPLDPTPTAEGRHFTFHYRFNASYPKTIEALSGILGLPPPLRIDEVIIWPDKIEVTEVDEYFAKQKVVEAFGKVRKTVSLKLGARR